MISWKQWKIITPLPLLSPVLHLHQGLTLQHHRQFHLDLPFSNVWPQVSYHLYQRTIHGHGVTIRPIPTYFIILPLVLVGQMNLTLLSPNLFPCLVGAGHPPPALHIIPVLLIHHLHQENLGTLSQPTEANVYVMTASVAVVACGKYTAVLYSCYFGCICFPLIFGVTFLNFSR